MSFPLGQGNPGGVSAPRALHPRRPGSQVAENLPNRKQPDQNRNEAEPVIHRCKIKGPAQLPGGRMSPRHGNEDPESTCKQALRPGGFPESCQQGKRKDDEGTVFKGAEEGGPIRHRLRQCPENEPRKDSTSERGPDSESERTPGLPGPGHRVAVKGVE